MKNRKKKAIVLTALISAATLAPFSMGLASCKHTVDDTPKPKPPVTKPIEKSYLVPDTKVTIKYMGLASDTGLPAEVSKLAGIISNYPSTYSSINRTLYVIDGSNSPAVKSNGTMETGRQWVISTSEDDIDDAIFDLRALWTAMHKAPVDVKAFAAAVVAQLPQSKTAISQRAELNRLTRRYA